MKILHIINNLATGGAEKLILDTLPRYAEQGIVADLLLLNGENFPFLKELKGKNCCRVFSLGKGSVYNPLHIFRLIPYLKKYDIIHVHLFPAQYFVVLAKIISRSKTTLIFTEHCSSNRRLENKLFGIIDKQIYKFYTKVVCISNEVKDLLVKYSNLNEKNFHVIENGINLEKIHSSKAYNKEKIVDSIKQTDQLLIQVAGFRAQKDQTTLIKAMGSLPDKFKLILVGDGILRQDAIALVETMKLSDRVFFLGIRTDIPALLKTADLIILSSKYEGLSLSSIEGMASGKPFIASDVPGLSEIVKNAGILFPVGDHQKLAAEILHLSSDKEHYNKIAAQCLQRAQEFDISKMVHKHIALYQTIIQS